MSLHAVPDGAVELVRPGLPTETQVRDHAALVVGELERLARWREALMRTAQMQHEAIEAQLAALQETQDFIRWIDDQRRPPMSPEGA